MAFLRILLAVLAVLPTDSSWLSGGSLASGKLGSRSGFLAPRLEHDDPTEDDMPTFDEFSEGLMNETETVEADEGGEDDDGTQDAGQEDVDHDYSSTHEHLLRVGSMADTNNDTLLSAEELTQFAFRMREQKRLKYTSAALKTLDSDQSGDITAAELSIGLGLPTRESLRFKAADADGDGILNVNDFHQFTHPELGGEVLRVEAEYQFTQFDTDSNRRITFEEFKTKGEADINFSEPEAYTDFVLHDVDGSGFLDAAEWERLVGGHDLLADSIKKVLSAADHDGDAHIHIHDEVSRSVESLLESEFIEDFFFHEYADAGRHDEL